MFTVKEINEVSFGKAGFSGYKPEDVDNFINDHYWSQRQQFHSFINRLCGCTFGFRNDC